MVKHPLNNINFIIIFLYNYFIINFILELPEEVVGFFLAMGPFSAMIFAPRIGAMSDDYDRPGYGKRTPFILYISAMILLGLLLIPYR